MYQNINNACHVMEGWWVIFSFPFLLLGIFLFMMKWFSLIARKKKQNAVFLIKRGMYSCTCGQHLATREDVPEITQTSTGQMCAWRAWPQRRGGEGQWVVWRGQCPAGCICLLPSSGGRRGGWGTGEDQLRGGHSEWFRTKGTRASAPVCHGQWENWLGQRKPFLEKQGNCTDEKG